MNVVFTHRPLAGISVGATSKDGVLYIAVAMANNGVSLNGNFNASKRDAFSRKRARKILEGRLAAAIASQEDLNGPPEMTSARHTSLSGREFMQQFRKLFKPTLDESDFMFTMPEVGRIGADAILFVIDNMIDQVLEKDEVPF